MGHVVYRNAAAGLPFRAPVVGVAVDDRLHRIAREWLVEPAAAGPGPERDRLAVNGCLDRRIVQHRECAGCAQPRQGRFELERLVDRFLDELLDRGLAPIPGRAAPETAAETFDAGE